MLENNWVYSHICIVFLSLSECVRYNSFLLCLNHSYLSPTQPIRRYIISTHDEASLNNTSISYLIGTNKGSRVELCEMDSTYTVSPQPVLISSAAWLVETEYAQEFPLAVRIQDTSSCSPVWLGYLRLSCKIIYFELRWPGGSRLSSYNLVRIFPIRISARFTIELV
jgi:hypothetical protein